MNVFERFLLVLVIFGMLSAWVVLFFQGKSLGALEAKVEVLRMDTLYLNMQIGTNKLLLKETQRMIVPDERALKREVVKW